MERSNFGTSGSEVEKSKKNKNKNKPKGKITGARVASVALSAALFFAAGYGTHYITDEYFEYKRALDLFKNYQEENACLLPSNATSTLCYDIEIAEGDNLLRAINKAKIDYCRIGDQYYTKDGIEIAVISLEVVRRDTMSSVAIESEKGKVYAAPDGYTIVGDDAYKDEKEVIVRVVPKSSEYSVNIENMEGVVSAEIIDVFETTSNKFSDIKSKTLICDVLDGEEATAENNYPATLKLVP